MLAKVILIGITVFGYKSTKALVLCYAINLLYISRRPKLSIANSLQLRVTTIINCCFSRQAFLQIDRAYLPISLYHKYSYRGWRGAIKWWSTGHIKLKYDQTMSIESFTYHKSLAINTSQSCGNFGQFKQHGTILLTTQSLVDISQVSETSHSKSRLRSC